MPESPCLPGPGWPVDEAPIVLGQCLRFTGRRERSVLSGQEFDCVGLSKARYNTGNVGLSVWRPNPVSDLAWRQWVQTSKFSQEGPG